MLNLASWARPKEVSDLSKELLVATRHTPRWTTSGSRS
jgi:hypothetical protein